MTEKKYNLILATVCGSLLILCVLAFMGKKSLSGETIDTALLNNKYSSDVSHVEITQNNKSLFLNKMEGFWLGSEGNSQSLDFQDLDFQGQSTGKSLVFPVDPTTIKEFISAMEQVRSLSIVSQKQDKDTLSSFGLDSESSYSVSLSLNDGSSVSQVTFGDKNYSGYRIYLKTPDSPLGINSPVYETQDHFYPWLSTSGKTWADMSLVSQSLLGITGEKQIQGLTMKILGDSGTIERTFSPTEENFTSKISRLLSLRGGSLILPSVVEGQPQVGEIRVDTGLGSRAILRVYQGKSSEVNQEISSYYLIPDYEISGLNFGFEISGWTWENIQELAQ